MRLDFPFRRLSLKARLTSNYLVILGIGGLATSMVGSWIVSSTIMMQARQSVGHNLATARSLYQQQLETLKHSVQIATSGTTIQQCLASGGIGLGIGLSQGLVVAGVAPAGAVVRIVAHEQVKERVRIVVVPHPTTPDQIVIQHRLCAQPGFPLQLT